MSQEVEGDKAGTTMMSEEEQDEGQVSYKVYWAYFKSGSGLLSILILITLAAAEAMNQYQSVGPKLAPLHTFLNYCHLWWMSVHGAVLQPGNYAGLLGSSEEQAHMMCIEL